MIYEQVSNMAIYMLTGFALAIFAVIFLLLSYKIKKYQFIAIFLSLYALVFYAIAITTKDPIEGIPTEIATIITAFPFGLILTKLGNDIWNMTKKFPSIESKINNIEKAVEKIPQLDIDFQVHKGKCEEKHKALEAELNRRRHKK